MMTQKKGILIAGTLTGLILMTLLAFGFTNVAALFRRDDAQAVQPVQDMQPVQLPAGATAADAQALQAYAAQLESALQVMQQREAKYQQQLQTANETIIELQQPAQSNPGSYEDDDAYEHEYEHDDDDRYEHEEHEEHEGYEHNDD